MLKRWLKGGKWYYYISNNKALPEWYSTPPADIKIPILRKETWKWRRPFTKKGVEELKIRATASKRYEDLIAEASKAHQLIKLSYIIGSDQLNIDEEKFQKRYIELHLKNTAPIRLNKVFDLICEALEDQNIFIVRNLIPKDDVLNKAINLLYVNLVKNQIVDCVGFGVYDLNKRNRNLTKKNK
jgi:hypothetical protein